MEQRLISLREASQYSGIDQNYLRVLINRNVLRGTKDRGDWFITETDLDDYLANHSRKKKKIAFNKIAVDVKPLEISAESRHRESSRKIFSSGGVLHSAAKENLVYFLNKEREEALANKPKKESKTPGDLSIHRYAKLIPKMAVGAAILAGLGSFVLFAGLGDARNLSRAVHGFFALFSKGSVPSDQGRFGQGALLEPIADILQKLDGLSLVILEGLGNDTYHFSRIFGQVFGYLGSDYTRSLATLLDGYRTQPGANLVSGLFSNLQPLFARFFIGSGLRETVTPAPGDFDFVVEVEKSKTVDTEKTQVVVQQVVTPVKQIVERIETFVPGDVGRLRLELMEVTQIEVNKLRAELAALQGVLTTTSRISDSSIRMVTLSQRIDELNAINIDNGATVRSGNLSVTSGTITAPSATFTNLTVTGSCTGCGGGGVQTPWASNIDGGGFNLTNAGSLTFTSFSATSTSATSTISTGGFAIGTNQFVVEQTSGNIGIGTTSPSQLFSVAGSAYFTGGVGIGAATTSANNLQVAGDIQVQNISISGTCSGCGSGGVGAGTANRLAYYTAATTVGSAGFLVIDTANNRLGIGTTTFGTLLTVGGDAFIGGNLTATGTISVAGGASLLSTLDVSGLSTLTGGILSNSSTSTIANVTMILATSTSATSTNFFATNLNATNSTSTNLYSTSLIAANATTSNLNIANTLTGAGLASCSGALNKLLWSSSTNQFSCASESGAGASNWTFSGTDAITPTATVGIIVNASSSITNLSMVNSTSTAATSTYLQVNYATLSTSSIGNLLTGTIAATSTAASSSFQNFLFTQAQGTGLSLANLTTSNATTTNLVAASFWINGERFSDLTGNSLQNSAGVLDTIQDIRTSASPTFAGLTLTGFSGALSASGGVISAGTLSVANGGTGATSFSSGGFLFGNGTGALSASSSPTVGWITATSTTASSSLQNLLFTQAQGTGLSLANLTVTNSSSTAGYVSGLLQVNGTASTSMLPISNLRNTSTQCLNITNQGVVGVAAADCGAGAGVLNPPLYLANARFGIGTSTPGALFSIAATSTNLADRTILYGLDNFVYASSSTSTIPSSLVNAFSIATSTSAIPLFTLDTANTRVGISTTSPGATLAISGIGMATTWNALSSTSALQIMGSTAFAAIPDSAIANTFIGFNAGVNNVNSAAGGINGTFVGYGAGSLNTTGDNNSAVGYQALASNSIGGSNLAVGASALYSNTSGTFNAAVGPQALYSNTLGSSNSALGYQALYSNNIGNDNSALGLQALYANTSGSYNSALGMAALQSNTTGNLNSAVGFQALTSNTLGSSNAALGVSALSANISGDMNTAIGSNALLSNTTGSRLVALGYEALNSNSTGLASIALGYQALRSQTTASSSIGIGYGAGYGLTTGNNNIFIGYRAGDTVTTGANNLIIGHDADAPTSATSNFLNLGDTLYGYLSARYLGIGTTTPGALLSIAATTTAFSNQNSILLSGINIIHASSSTTTIPSAVNAFSFATSSSAIPFLSFDSTNYRIGLGTTSPAQTLSIGGAGNVYLLGGLGVGVATTTTGVIETIGVINVGGSGPSTFANGINATTGCFDAVGEGGGA